MRCDHNGRHRVIARLGADALQRRLVEIDRVERRRRSHLLFEALGQAFADKRLAQCLAVAGPARARDVMQLVRQQAQHAVGPLRLIEMGDVGSTVTVIRAFP